MHWLYAIQVTIVSFRFTEGLQSLLCLGPHGDLGDVTVDVPVQVWPGEVGFVTEPLRRLRRALTAPRPSFARPSL